MVRIAYTAGLSKLESNHFVGVDGKHYLLEECC